MTLDQLRDRAIAISIEAVRVIPAQNATDNTRRAANKATTGFPWDADGVVRVGVNT